MARYKVLRDCYGFKGGYWKQDTIAEFADDEIPPPHFERVDGKVVEEPVAEPESPRTFSEINKANDAEKPKTGMFHKPKAEKPKK